MKVDMSAKAITLRLKRVSQLRDLCISLSKAKKIENKINNSSTTHKTSTSNG
jgi:hypothetical protein